jgi:ribosomal protein S27AE
MPVYEIWEGEREPIKKCPKCGKDLCPCDDPDRLHCSDSKCGWTEIIAIVEDNIKSCPVCGASVAFQDDDMGTLHVYCSNEDCTFKAEVDYK